MKVWTVRCGFAWDTEEYNQEHYRFSVATRKLTFVYLLDGSDEVVNKVLEITQRVGDARRLVYLCKWGIENRDDIFQKL